MIIPEDLVERELFYNDLKDKCSVSIQERTGTYDSLRSYYLFGSGLDAPPAYYNKIYPHIDQLSSFLYSAETTRFSISLGASINPHEQTKIPALTGALNDDWLNSNADQVFAQALNWALCYNSTFIKLIPKKGIHPYMVDPRCIGVLREDTPYTDRQEALVQIYYITKSELYARLYSHPNRDALLARVQQGQSQENQVPDGIQRLILSATDPTMYGNVNLNIAGMQQYKARVAEDTIRMTELWVWNDNTDDYQCVTIADPDVIIYDRSGASMFLKGELPFIQLCPTPQYDYYWGISEVARLVFLQDMRNKRMTEILDLLSKQVSPPTALIGFTGLLDEKNFALNRVGGLLTTDMPNAKVEQMAPSIPNDLFREIAEIDRMFEEASGIVNVLQGRGESGVRSAGHASQLARLGSSRAKKRALIIEDALEKMATLYLKCMQVYSDRVFVDDQGQKFIPNQFTNDFVVKVDAHSNSPIFTEDLRSLAFALSDRGAMTKERLIDILEPPMKQLLKEDLRKMEQAAQAAQTMQNPQPEPETAAGPMLQRVV
jgi:hypothetical protein